MNIENLKILSAYLKGPLKADFDMAVYGLSYGETCGTVGCAAGHGPYAGILKHVNESWTNYVTRAFDLSLFDIRRHWCFSCCWCDRDNTALGAAKRIDWLLEYGLPDSATEQIVGIVPLCYN